MLKLLKKALTPTPTTDKALGGLTKIMKQLTAVADHHYDEAVNKNVRAEVLQQQAVGHHDEAAKARRAASKFADLLG